jgi:sulfide dehydrogenase cytochrome subunit
VIVRLLLAALLVTAASPAARAEMQTPPPGASSCSGCHAAKKTVDTPLPRLVGRSPADIEAAMTAFRSGERPSLVMQRIAKGFNDDEVKAIAAWYGAQKD